MGKRKSPRDRAHAILAAHAKAALETAGDNLEVAAQVLVDRAATDLEFGRELEAMERDTADQLDEEFDGDLDRALRLTLGG